MTRDEVGSMGSIFGILVGGCCFYLIVRPADGG
jgi:hypothetical protein